MAVPKNPLAPQRSLNLSRWLLLVFCLSVVPGALSAQSTLRVEVSGGVGIPAFMEWAKSKSVGPAASVGLSNRFGETWGWVVSAQWHFFPYNSKTAETTNLYPSEPPGDILEVTTTDLQGGDFHMVTAVVALRLFLKTTGRNKTYLTFGIVGGSTIQKEATVLETQTLDGEVISTQRVPWTGESSDIAAGVVAGLGVAIPLDEKLEAFGEIGYQALLTPDDSFPDNPDFLTAMAGIRLSL